MGAGLVAPGPPLTPRQVQRLAVLRHAARVLDSAFRVPGTSRRIGLDPLIGLVPGSGDLVAPLFTIVLLWQGRALGVPRVIQLRMLANAGIDALIGMVPLAGDLFDFAWKANERNVLLLERFARDRRPSIADRVFLGLLIVLLLAVAAVPVLLAAMLVALAARIW